MSSSGTLVSSRRSSAGPTWKRVLYERQTSFVDNFVDSERFFAQLTISRPTLHKHYLPAFTYASLAAQQFCAVVVIYVLYKYLRSGRWTEEDLAIFNASLLMAGLVLHYLLSDIPSVGRRAFYWEKIKVGGLFAVCLRLATPVLQTLTLSFSEDTVHALAIALVTLHLACHDYSYVSGTTDTFSGTISLNAAIFTGILLASRLQQHSMVMHAVMLAVLVFSLFPVIARLVKQRSLRGHWILVLAQALLAGVLLQPHRTLLAVFTVLLALLLLIAPLVFLQMQRIKATFHGPWEISKDL